MLWTVIPPLEIIRGIEKIPPTGEYAYQNRRILGYPTAEGKVCIVRTLSTDPADFLDPRFQPGNIVLAKKL